MTLTIEIPDEAAARIRDAAIARGQDLGTFAVAAVLQTADVKTAEAYDPLPWDEFAALMIEGVDPNAPELSDYAVSREGIYEDHG